MHQPENQDLYRFLAGDGVMNVAQYGFPADVCDQFPGMQSFCSSSYYPLEVAGLADTPPQDRALAALKNHKEAEKRRRERINSHLDKLRSLLPCNSKVIINYLNLCVWKFFYAGVSYVCEFVLRSSLEDLVGRSPGCPGFRLGSICFSLRKILSCVRKSYVDPIIEEKEEMGLLRATSFRLGSICYALHKILVFAVFWALLTVWLLGKGKKEREILQSRILDFSLFLTLKDPTVHSYYHHGIVGTSLIPSPTTTLFFFLLFFFFFFS
jgi:hypothetical protein